MSHSALGPQFHGTQAVLQPGDVLEPQERRTHDSSGEHVYFTPHEHVARSYAQRPVLKEPPGHVYEVEPLGAVEPDPNVITPGISYRAPRARVLRRVVTPPA